MKTRTQLPGNTEHTFTNKDIVIPDQTGTLAIVTGANSGIGLGVNGLGDIRTPALPIEAPAVVRAHQRAIAGLYAPLCSSRTQHGWSLYMNAILLLALAPVRDNLSGIEPM